MNESTRHRLPLVLTAAVILLAVVMVSVSTAEATKVVTSAISAQGAQPQVRLVGTSVATHGNVRSFFQSASTKPGMTASVLPSADGTVAITFSRGSDRITVPTVIRSARTRLSVFTPFTPRVRSSSAGRL